MEHKPIYLDGVDVSECLFYQSNFEEDYDVKIKHFCSNWHNSCESVNNSNCYYKQLARKTQELKTICKAFDIEYGYDEGTGVIVGRCNKLIEKENELEEYKQSLNERNKFLQDLGISAGGEFKRIKFYIENLKNKYNENARYRKALEEIEKIVSMYLVLQRLELQKAISSTSSTKQRTVNDESKRFIQIVKRRLSALARSSSQQKIK